MHLRLRAVMGALFLAATAAQAEEPVPCEGAEALSRLVKMTIDGMQAFGAACAADPGADACVRYNLALVASADVIQPGDAEKVSEYDRWIGERCPNLAGKFGR